MNTKHWIPLALGIALALTACGDKDDSGADDSGAHDTGSAALAACELARQWNACDECYSGEVTCEYGETSATEGSCYDCQARSALYEALCDAGITDSRADIEAGTTCSDPV